MDCSTTRYQCHAAERRQARGFEVSAPGSRLGQRLLGGQVVQTTIKSHDESHTVRPVALGGVNVSSVELGPVAHTATLQSEFAPVATCTDDWHRRLAQANF